MPVDNKDFPLGIKGYVFSDLYKPEKLRNICADFWEFAHLSSPGVKERFDLAHAPDFSKPQKSEVLIEVARILGDFIAKLFNVASYVSKLKNETSEFQPIFRFKREFIKVFVQPRLSEPPCSADEFNELTDRFNRLIPKESPGDLEAVVSEIAMFLLDSQKKAKENPLPGSESVRLQGLCSHLGGNTLTEKVGVALKDMENWVVQSCVDKRRHSKLSDWVSLLQPGKLDFEKLVPTQSPDSRIPELHFGHDQHQRARDGFHLTDLRMNQKQILREIDYCMYCHNREKDSCSTGFVEKKGGYKKNPLGISLEGCPLDEKISEMHVLRKSGDAIGSLAMVMLDNPMVPGTGHRICNDCMKGCIFQKQDPVNIPQAETGVLSDVLNLPYGFEIYSLLTRFNPLNRARPYALPYNGKDVLVVGLGPAGYTLAHYLANSGFGVVGIDALKLEPIDSTLTGVGRAFPKPVASYSELQKDLDERVLLGFGGVSEYGITVRWDKNFLMVIYLSLLRRNNIRFFGGVRFGGTLTLEDAWELGFQHVAIATGAGKPTVIGLKNNLIRGIRKASDFLMALQLTGAYKKSSLANLQMKLPAVIIGGGLTAIDTATELLAYYPRQVEKTLERFETLTRHFGEPQVWKMCDEEESIALKTFLQHGNEIREERRQAEKEKRPPQFTSLLRKWGGVTIAYRKKMMDSPAYRLNHEEIIKALEEGIGFAENLNPIEAIKDKFGAVSELKFQRQDGSFIMLPAKTVCVAAGTSPNIIYEREYPGTFKLDPKQTFFQKYRLTENGTEKKLVLALPEDPAFFLSYENNGKFVTFYGDNHPDYAGNVVKAMASAKHGFPHIAKLFKSDIALAESGQGSDFSRFEKLTQFLDRALIPRIMKVVRLTPTIVEVIVKARYASRKFQPGQFYRLQNYESLAHLSSLTRLTMEGIALTGAWVDKEGDLLSLIVLEMGTSSRLCATLRPGEPVVLMGPTGTPSEIPHGEKVLLAGGGLGNAVLLSIAKALRENECKVIYFAGYKKKEDLFKQHEVEAGTDQVIWSVDKGEPIFPSRAQDMTFVGNILEAMEAYGSGKLKKPVVPLNEVDRIIAIGSDKMMAAVTKARHEKLKSFFKPNHVGIVSINSPMQCMMKEVCAQCLQRHIDPKTGKEQFVFSCFNQDQEMDRVDFQNLNHRLRANSLQEKLTNQFLDYLMEKGKMDRV